MKISNRITPYLKGCPDDMLVDACEAFAEEQEEVERLKAEIIAGIDGLVMLRNERAMRDMLNEVANGILHLSMKE